MKKLISKLAFLALMLAPTFNCLAYDLSDRGRISDFRRYNGGDEWSGFIVIAIIGAIAFLNGLYTAYKNDKNSQKQIKGTAFINNH